MEAGVEGDVGFEGEEGACWGFMLVERILLLGSTGSVGVYELFVAYLEH